MERVCDGVLLRHGREHVFDDVPIRAFRRATDEELGSARQHSTLPSA
jgi:hypothetical protein